MKKVFCAVLSLIVILSAACTTLPTGGEETTKPTVPPASSAPIATEIPTEAETEATEQPTEPQLVKYGEPVIRQWVELNDAEPCFQFMIPVKNISEDYVAFRRNTYMLKGKDGETVAFWEGADCAPYYLAPGQEGIIYHEAINRDGIDYLSPEYSFEYIAVPEAVTWDFEALEISDIQFNKNLGSTEIRGNLINDTDCDFSFPPVTFLFYDADGNILCAAYGMGGSNDYESENFGVIQAHSTCPFVTYRYWMPDDYPLENVTVKAFAFGNID